MDKLRYRVDGIARIKAQGSNKIGEVIKLRDFRVDRDDLDTLVETAIENGLEHVDRDSIEMINVRVFEDFGRYNFFKGFVVVDMIKGRVVEQSDVYLK